MACSHGELGPEAGEDRRYEEPPASSQKHSHTSALKDDFIILCLHPSCLERLSAVVIVFEAKSDEDRWAPLVPSIVFLSNPTLSRPWPLRRSVSWGYVSHRDDQTGGFVVERSLEVSLYFSLEVQLVTPR